MPESYNALKKLDRITDLLREQNTLTQQLVDAAQGRTAPVVSAAELDEKTDLVGTVYQLEVPEEPPVGTVVIGRNQTIVVRKASGWQITGAILTSTWISVLHKLRPLTVIHQVTVPEGDD